MKNLVSILMITSIAIQLFWSSGYLMEYYINTDAYKKMCVNKDLPELRCDGKCILAQKIKEQRRDAESKPEYILSPVSFEFTLSDLSLFEDKVDYPVAKTSTIYFDNYKYLTQASIFKPPI